MEYDTEEPAKNWLQYTDIKPLLLEAIECLRGYGSGTYAEEVADKLEKLL